jgi:pSer/pThr/pTyr-binding forkhead associated (FHA) protein
MHQGKIIKILDYQLPKVGEYVVLEGAARHSKNSKIIHVLNLGMNDAIKLGRGHESNIRISDISVSRCHAIIRYVDKKFYIEDNNSKFGTLIGFNAPILINKPI